MRLLDMLDDDDLDMTAGGSDIQSSDNSHLKSNAFSFCTVILRETR